MGMVANWFVALPVRPGAFLARLTPPAWVRLFGQDDLHMTVAFLGRVREEQALAAFEAAQPFPLSRLCTRLGEVKALGNPRRPSAISALPIAHRAQIEHAICQARSGACAAAGVPCDTRPALAHVTFARPSRRATPAQLASALSWARQLDLAQPEVRIEELALYTWASDRSSALFRIVCARALPHPPPEPSP